MASSRLNLDLLRSGLLTSPHGSVRAGPSLTRRQLLLAAGVAAAGLRLKGSLVEAAGKGFTLDGGAHRLAFRVAGEERWVLDPSLFSGRPRLAVDQQEDLITVRLSNATYPGTELPADLLAEIRRVDSGWQMRLEMALGRFTAELPFEPWLAGLAVARSPVQLASISLPLSRSLGLLLGGPGLAHYFPDGSLRLRGSGIAGVERGQVRLQADEVAIEALPSRASSLIKSPSHQRTRLTLLRGKQEWPLNLGLTHPGGSLVAEGSPFDQIQIELDGDRRSGALLATAGGTATLAFRPAGGLTGSDGRPFRLRLTAAQQALAFGPEGDEEALLAQFDPNPTWLHAEGCSLQVGEGPVPRLFELRGRSGEAPQLDCRPNLQAIALPLAGAVVEPTYLDGTTHLRFDANGLALETGPLAANQPLDLSPISPPLIPGPIRLPLTFGLSILRPDDLLALRFQFLNLKLETGGGQSPRLVRTDKSESAYLLVHFPPQHIAEQVFDKGATPSDPPIKARMAGESRLAFLIPSHIESIPYTLESLLDWSQLELSVPPSGLVLLPSSNLPANPGLIRSQLPIFLTPIGEPELHETAIEAPYRLILAPHHTAGWAHARTLEEGTQSGRTELWHTRLGVRTDDGAVDEQEADNRTMRAPWSPDYDSKHQPKTSDTPFATPMTRENRSKIVANSAGLGSGTAPLQVNRFILSSLGAWIDLHGDWNTSNGLEGWKHQAVMGRDQFVRIAESGYLLPFGHRASLITITERKLEPAKGGKIAYLRKREYILVRERQRSFTDSGKTGRQMPFRKVWLLTEATPDLQGPHLSVEGVQRAFWPKISSTEAFHFQLAAEDWTGRRTEFTAPLVFVHKEIASNPANMTKVAAYLAQEKKISVTPQANDLRQVPFSGQSVAFAPSQKAGDTTLEASTITFTLSEFSGSSLGHPIMKEAQVRVPAVEQMGGNTGPIPIQFDAGYLSSGFGGANKGEVWAKTKYAPSLEFPATAAGGLISPNMNISGLSRAMGPVGGALDQFAQGRFDPTTFFNNEARILGGLALSKIIKEVSSFDPLGDGRTVPRLTTRMHYPMVGGVENRRALPEAVETTFTWKPGIKRDPAGVFVPNSNSVLELDGKLLTRLGAKPEATASFTGKLNDVAINLVGEGGAGHFITVRFKRLNFTGGTGRSPSVDVDIQAVEFKGALSFVETLQRYLKSPGGGLALDVSTAGVTAGFTLAIPTVQVGVFALSNLKLMAGFHLPFTNAPARLSFALSERHNPFNVTVAAFGGGGFFAIRLGTDRVELLEASLEFGGQVSLNIGVASGGVSIMAGIYFRLENEIATLEGYLRANGRLSVLGLVTITAEFYLSLTYKSGGKAWGRAELTVGIKIAFFKKSVTLSVERQFAGKENDPTFADLMDQPHWDAYCGAFA